MVLVVVHGSRLVPVLEGSLRLGPVPRACATSVHTMYMARRKRELDVARRREAGGRVGEDGGPSGTPPARVTFVCTGNICRSPMAEVVLRAYAAEATLADGSKLSDRLVVSSAGTSSWHEGEPMDPRAHAVLEARGYTDHGHVAQPFETSAVRLDRPGGVHGPWPSPDARRSRPRIGMR